MIVTFNSEDDIVRCIQSLNKHFFMFKKTQKDCATIIIDNNSTDNTTSLINQLKERFSWLSSIENKKNIGFGPANNLVFKIVKSKYYVLINADAWLISDSISPVITTISKQKDIAICGLPLVYPDGSPQTYSYSFSSWHRWLMHTLKLHKIVNILIRFNLFKAIFEQLPYSRTYIRNQLKPILDIEHIDSSNFSHETKSVDWVCGAGMIISRDFLKQSGGFDENIFLYGEDEDLCITAHNTGFNVVIAEVAPIVHKLGWKGSGFNPVVAKLKYNSLSYFVNKNIKNKLPKLLMKIILPFYVFGIRRFYYVIFDKSNQDAEMSTDKLT